MSTNNRYRLAVFVLAALVMPAADALAQFPRWPRPRPARIIPEDNRGSVGLTFGPSARTTESGSTGLDIAVAGEIPFHDGLRGRAEIGASTWKADPLTERGASRLTLTRGSLGIYRLTGVRRFHTFVGGGLGLYRHRVTGAAGSGTKGGVYGGMGMEYLGARRGFGLEFRVNVTGTPAVGPHTAGLMMHGAMLASVKRVF